MSECWRNPNSPNKRAPSASPVGLHSLPRIHPSKAAGVYTISRTILRITLNICVPTCEAKGIALYPPTDVEAIPAMAVQLQVGRGVEWISPVKANWPRLVGSVSAVILPKAS